MRKRLVLIAASAAALAVLAGCGSSARNEQAEAASAIAADPNATMGEAISDVEAASDKALGAGEPGAGNAQQDVDDSSNVIDE